MYQFAGKESPFLILAALALFDGGKLITIGQDCTFLICNFFPFSSKGIRALFFPQFYCNLCKIKRDQTSLFMMSNQNLFYKLYIIRSIIISWHRQGPVESRVALLQICADAMDWPYRIHGKSCKETKNNYMESPGSAKIKYRSPSQAP